ncbi:serine hydrolase domain-containing protein [Aestuariivita sp.]|uniref:serine hydrolase domain-containing protein n=1 Tax=Aestuariivita sp. TaxID=1872407 RepID=UPI003BB0F58C
MTALPQATGSLNAFGYRGADGAPTTFGQMLEETYTDAMFVWKNGQCLHESYHNAMSPQTLHLLQSVSKSITATAAACLFAERMMDPSAPITDYLPELGKTAWNGASVQHVLDMTSGMAFNETYEARDSDVGKMDFAARWKPAPPGVDATSWPGCIRDQILSLTDADAGHGQRFSYHSIETEVLAHAMERVTGQPLAEIISDRLWKPLGCEKDANITVDTTGYGLACGGINATLRDLARFAIALANNGDVGGRNVIPRAWIADIRCGNHGLFDDESRQDFPNGRYRNQFWIEDVSGERHLCLGVFGQLIFVSPASNFIAVKLSSWPSFSDTKCLNSTLAALHAVETGFS